MAGNVWEWTADRYDSEQYGRTLAQNPPRLLISKVRVVRSGSWSDFIGNVRAADRFKYELEGRVNHVGMRLVIAPGF